MLIIALALAINGAIVKSRAKATFLKASACDDPEERAALMQMAHRQTQTSNVFFSLAGVAAFIAMILLASMLE